MGRREKTKTAPSELFLDGGRVVHSEHPRGKGKPRPGLFIRRVEAEGGACCKEVGSAPQILATLPLSYRNTDGAALSFTLRPQKALAEALGVTPMDLLDL